MGRIVKFQVRVGREEGPHKWVGVDPGCVLVGDPGDAQTFSVRTALTPAAQLRIDQAEHEIAGGLNAYLDLHTGLERAFAALEEQLVLRLWPDGRPEAPTAELKQEQAAAIEEAAQADSSKLKRGYDSMQEMASRIQFLAAWPEIVEDPPDGWDNLADKEMPTSVVQWMHGDYLRAVKEAITGK